MKKLNKYLFVSILALLCLVFVGCGSGSDDSDTKPKPDDKDPVVEEVFYDITWNDENGNLLETKKIKENEIPTYNYTIKDTDDFKLIFKGWAKEANGEVINPLPKATANATYFAIVEKLTKYDVVFKDFEGKVIKTEKVVEGSDATAPTAPNVKGYTFTKWDKKFTNVKADLEVNAIYTINEYTITFMVNGGSVVEDIKKEYLTEISEPEKPKYENHKFVSWCYDKELTKPVTWPIKIEEDMTLYAKWNETVDIKGYLKSMVNGTKLDPFSFIPNPMRPTYSQNNVFANEVNYDYNSFVNVSSMKFGGFGEQWHMVIDNISQSENFYKVLTLGEDIINTSVAAFNNYLDKNPADTADHTLKETKYTASLKYANNILYYTIVYKTNLNIPLFGEVTPQIDMIYDVTTGEKAVRINLNQDNAIKYTIVENCYVFGIEYTLAGISRKAYCEFKKDDKENTTGHIYEFIKAKDKDLIASCADFYITNEYVSVVGNKASGLIGFKGYINELYNVKTGKLLGYEVRETTTIAGITATYNTLWFNLNNITGINSVKALPKTDNKKLNPHDVYVNNNSTMFEPKYNSKLGVKTSRKFDIELRDQYFYEYDLATKKYIEHKVATPMMFIQEGDNFNDFVADMKVTNKITTSVTLSKVYLDKILADYDTLIDIFITNKENITSVQVDEFIGNPIIVK